MADEWPDPEVIPKVEPYLENINPAPFRRVFGERCGACPWSFMSYLYKNQKVLNQDDQDEDVGEEGSLDDDLLEEDNESEDEDESA